MFSFRSVDFIDLDCLLSEEEKLVRRTARQFVDDRVLPVIRECFREARFPLHLIPELGELGFLGANLEGYGCAGMEDVEYGLLMQELERGDSGVRSLVSVQSALVMWPILEYGSRAQKDRWLPELRSGRKIGCFGLTEPDFGSNPAGMRTQAVRDGGSFVLNGEKNVDHERNAGGRRAGVGSRGRTDPGLSRREGHAGIHDDGHSRQVVDEGFGDFEPGFHGLPHSRGECAAGSPGFENGARLPVAGALRDRLGMYRRCDGLL